MIPVGREVARLEAVGFCKGIEDESVDGLTGTVGEDQSFPVWERGKRRWAAFESGNGTNGWFKWERKTAGTFESEEDEEREFILFLGRVADLAKEAKVVVRACVA
jgi:hypothetical protein